MGLSASLSNALSGLKVSQTSLEILSRNVANSGTAGYHKQSLGIKSATAGGSNYAVTTGLNRAFNESLTRSYNTQVSDTAYAQTMATFMERLEAVLSTPGGDGSLDTLYAKFENALQSLATSPDDYSVRSGAVSAAQSLSEALNELSDTVQYLRQDAEAQISAKVTQLNADLSSLADINNRLKDQAIDEASRASLLDQRDRLVASVSEVIDVTATYSANGTVTVSTRAGVSLVDIQASAVEFNSAGAISAISTFDTDASKSTVGTLTLRTSSGLELNIVGQGILQSGELAALVDLRDTALVDVQEQLDEIASGLALSMSTVTTEGSAVTTGASEDGFDIDLANVQPGNYFTLDYTEGGVDKTLKVIRVDDPTQLPLGSPDADGRAVLGIDFSGGMANVATTLQTYLGANFTVSNPAGSTLRIVDDGLASNSDVTALTSKTTVTASQGQGLALQLFTDTNGTAYTDSLDGNDQKTGFSGRITVNRDILSDNSLLVQYVAGASLGDASRAEHLLGQLQNVTFTGTTSAALNSATFRLKGNVGALVTQMLSYQGNAIATAQSTLETRQTTLESINARMNSEFGVNVDEEMSRLLELQNAYAASARVVSVVQELIDNLMNI